MHAVNYTTATKNLASMMDSVCRDCNPVIITKNNDCAVVMISLADYEAMNETDYLLRNPANAEHLRKSIDSFRRGNMKSVVLSYVKDMEENIREVSEVAWRKSYRLGIMFFISAILGTLSIFYLYARYSFWPTFIDNIMKTVNFFKNKR